MRVPGGAGDPGEVSGREEGGSHEDRTFDSRLGLGDT